MFEFLLGLCFCIPALALIMFISVLLQAILDAIGGKKKKKKQGKAAQEQQDVQEEVLLITWRNING